MGGAHATAEEARANICGVRRCERSAVNVTTPLYVQKARILATYVRLVKRDDDRLAAARSRGGRARMRWRQGARLAVAWAREQASRAATEAERLRLTGFTLADRRAALQCLQDGGEYMACMASKDDS